MIKKLLIAGVIFLSLFRSADIAAQDGGKIILDLREEEDKGETGLPGIIGAGVLYVNDVKQYNEQFLGDEIDKDFSADIRSKYPRYKEKQVQKYQEYVRKGVKGYRLFEDLKKKFIDYVLKKEPPLTVADDQYEMGESETYIESKEPLVIHRFKKVVAYSNNEKERLAAQEKYAKDNKLTLPSQIIEKYKKALLEKDWATLFDLDLRDYFAKLFAQPEGKADIDQEEAKAVILSKFNGIDANKKIEGVILVQPKEKSIALLSKYRDYKGLSVNFDASENLENTQVHFVLPQIINVDEHQILVYTTKFPIYFSAEVKDASKQVVLRPQVEADICWDNYCKTVVLQPEMELAPKQDVRETSFSSYVGVVGQNIPSDANHEAYEFGKLVLEDKVDGQPKRVRFEVEVKDPAYFRTFVIGKYASYLGKANMKIDGNKVTVRFDVIDPEFNPLGKELTFWVRTNTTNQYFHKAVVEKISHLDIAAGQFSVGILLLAFAGGLLLNLMPCVFPVLSLKLLAFTQFGGLNLVQIRRNFAYNSLGIMVSFLCMGALLVGLKLAGYALGWGIQFQNIYFLATIIWVVTLFLAHILGFINLRSPQNLGKVLDKNKDNACLFEFLSGVFLVVLSTPCMAPYLGTAFGVALAGSIIDILLTVAFVGLGLATPYLLIAAFPTVALSMPKPGKWMNTLNLLMVVLLVITLCWLVSVLAAQSADAEVWHWALYILAALCVLFFRKAINTEIDKLSNHKIAAKLYSRANIVFGVVMAVLIGCSVLDSAAAATKRRAEVAKTKENGIHFDLINAAVKDGGKVLVKVGADWCLTCRYNKALVFDVEYVMDHLQNNNVWVIDVDWTHYDSQVLAFMKKFGRSGLPFYVLFSPTFPDGIVLPEVPTDEELMTLIDM